MARKPAKLLAQILQLHSPVLEGRKKSKDWDFDQYLGHEMPVERQTAAGLSSLLETASIHIIVVAEAVLCLLAILYLVVTASLLVTLPERLAETWSLSS